MGNVEALARSLNGTLSLDLAEGRIGHMSLIRELGSIGKFIAGKNADERVTPVKSLTGSFTVTNGVAQTDDLKASFEEGTLSAAGSVNLVDQNVNLRAHGRADTGVQPARRRHDDRRLHDHRVAESAG